MARGRRVLAWIGTCLLLLAIVVPILIGTFDWNLLKPTLNGKVSEALDRPFAIHGELAVDWRRADDGGWLPWPHVRASDLVLGNPPWAGEPQFIHLERLEFRLAPLPLLLRRVVIPRIEVTRPVANLERLVDGRDNWTFDAGREEGEPSSWSLELGDLIFDQAQFHLRDQRNKADVELQVDPLDKPVPFRELVGRQAAQRVEKQGAKAQDYAFGWRLRGRYQGQALSGSGKLGGLLALQDASRPFPVQAELRAGDTVIALAGTLSDPRHLGALDLRLRLSGVSMAQLYPLTGVMLPETSPYATDGHLIAQLQAPSGAVYSYRDFNGKVGDSDLHGSLTYVAGQPRPKLTGVLHSEQLRFADLAPLIGADTEAQKRARGASSQQPGERVLPAEAFRTDRWRTMDADVSFAGKRIVQREQLPFSDLATHLLLEDGLLRLEPLRFGVAGGQLETRIRLDSRATPLEGRAWLRARNLQIKQLFPGFAPMQSSLGELNGDAEIVGRGNSLAAQLGSADGQLRLLVNDGKISSGLMEIAGLNLGNYLVTQLFGDREERINCAAADLTLQSGLARPRLFVLDTENAIIHIEGSANLATERLDLSISPASKGLRLFSLRSPLYVRGSFKQPDAGVKPMPLVVRGAGAAILGTALAPAAGLLALVAPSGGEDSACAQSLARLRAEVPASRER